MRDLNQLYRYSWRKWPHQQRNHGRLCKLLACGKLNNALVEFIDDGEQVVIDRRALRKVRK